MWYGLDWIATVPPTVKLATDAFGKERAPIMFGWIAAGHQLGAAITAFSAGWIRTTLGDYQLAFWFSGGLCLVAALLALAVGRRSALFTADAPFARTRDVTALLSVLDLSPIVQGGSAAESFRNTLDLARHAERLGYHRFWLAEHHNIPSVASAATSVIIEHVASGTKTIRVGAGGIMLPNHSPLVIAEQFGTLESLHPGRIDLALGRAPGSDQTTAQALRRTPQAGDMFPQDVHGADVVLSPTIRRTPCVRCPARGSMSRSASSDRACSARSSRRISGCRSRSRRTLRRQLLAQAIEIYRARFKPSRQLEKPYLMLGANVVAADTGRRSAAALHVVSAVVRERCGAAIRCLFRRRSKATSCRFTPIERAQLEPMLSMAIVGGPETVRRRLREFIATTGADEIIIASQLFDHAARLRSYEIGDGGAPVVKPYLAGSFPMRAAAISFGT